MTRPDPMRHEGRVVFITGAARGIGRAVAERHAHEGANIVACDIAADVVGAQTTTAGSADLAHTADLVAATGRECLLWRTDVRDQDSLDEAVAAALDRFGRIDALVANAGIMYSAPLWEATDEAFRTVLDINVGGVWRAMKAVAPHMIDQRAGAVVAIGSVQSRTARKYLSAYTASKHAVVGLVKTAALELGAHNVRVNAVLPGAIRTAMIDNDDTGHISADADDQRTMYFRQMAALRNRSVLPAEAIASAVSWLTSDDAEHVTGIELPVDAGSLVLPGLNHSPVIDSPSEIII